MMDTRGCMHLNRFETFRIKPVSRWAIQYYSLSHFIWRQLNEICSPWRYILTVCDRLEVLFFSNCSWQILFCCRFYVLPPPGLIYISSSFLFHTYIHKQTTPLPYHFPSQNKWNAAVTLRRFHVNLLLRMDPRTRMGMAALTAAQASSHGQAHPPPPHEEYAERTPPASAKEIYSVGHI